MTQDECTRFIQKMVDLNLQPDPRSQDSPKRKTERLTKLINQLMAALKAAGLAPHTGTVTMTDWKITIT